MKDRILQIRKASGLTQAQFGAMIGATRPMIASYEGGKVIPDKSIQMLICQKFDVNLVWLQHGKGEMTSTGPFEPQLHKILRRHPDLQAALELLVEDNDPEFWAALNTVAHKLVEQKKKKEAE